MARKEMFHVNQLTVNTINGFPYAGGMGIGEQFYLVPATSSTSLYREFLLANGVDPTKIYSTLAAAESDMKANRNDVLYVFPGDHAVTASITWDKSVTSIVGVTSPNQRYQPSTLTTGGTRIKCVTTGIDNILNITGDYVSLYNFGTYNSYDAAGNVCDIKVAGRNFYAEGCSFRGGTGAAQIAAVAGVPVYINSAVAGGGNAAWFKNCVLGSSGNTTRTAGPGCLYCVGGAAAGFSIKFDDCEFQSRIEAETGSQVSQVLLEANYAVDRELLFNRCNFYNFVENLANQLDVMCVDECTTTHTITISAGCTFSGIDAVATPMTYVKNCASVGHATGGFGVNS